MNKPAKTKLVPAVPAVLASAPFAKFLAAVRARRVPEREYFAAMRALAASSKRLPWMIGDALAAGEHAYGQKYLAALASFDLEKQTLKNLAWVCAALEPSRRRDQLSFAHHAEVAHLDPREQDRFLQRAIDEAWTRSQLRIAIRKARATEPETGTGRVGFVPLTWELEGIGWYEDQIAAGLDRPRAAALAAQVAGTIQKLQRLHARLAAL